MLYNSKLKTALIPFDGKKNVRSRKLTNLLHSILITCAMKFQNTRTRECTLVWWISKQRLYKLGNTFNFHSNSTNAQDMWFLNQLCVYVLERKWRSLFTTYKPFHVHHKILYVSFHITHYLIRLAFLALECCLEWDQNGPIRH